MKNSPLFSRKLKVFKPFSLSASFRECPGRRNLILDHKKKQYIFKKSGRNGLIIFMSLLKKGMKLIFNWHLLGKLMRNINYM